MAKAENSSMGHELLKKKKASWSLSALQVLYIPPQEIALKVINNKEWLELVNVIFTFLVGKKSLFFSDLMNIC